MKETYREELGFSLHGKEKTKGKCSGCIKRKMWIAKYCNYTMLSFAIILAMAEVLLLPMYSALYYVSISLKFPQ